MHCSKCGFELKEDTNFCPECGKKNKKNIATYTDKIPTSDLQATTNTINTKHTRIGSSIIISALILIVLLAIGIVSYSIAYSKLSANNIKNKANTTLKSKIIPKDNITSNKDSEITTDTAASTDNVDINKVDSPDYYFFTSSGSEKLLDTDVSKLSKQDLALARNEIFARHGLVFETEPFKSYFNKKSWYKSDTNFKVSNGKLNNAELYNVQLIQKHENN